MDRTGRAGQAALHHRRLIPAHLPSAAVTPRWAALWDSTTPGRSRTRARSSSPAGRRRRGGYKECLDFSRPAAQRDVARTVTRLRAIAPNTGASFALAWHLPLTCAGWPAPVTNPPTPMPRTLPPLLGAGTWQDHDSTRRVVEQIPGSRTIEHDGPGHNLFGAMANPCVIDHVSRYVTERRLPPRGTTCP
ncbi:alpha/beta hydrolase [Nonomuraea turkmeniaca]|uniref:alpha/beta hydrolase n=1 Tax=Nonomuraea turkmeniaca TaxID=103838 RepID=UPI0024823B40|nr:alpha/beta hydrolase [Nonomuraea turkmeniaca]